MSYKCHHCYIFSSDLPRALEYQTQIFIDMNQHKLADCWQHFSLCEFQVLIHMYLTWFDSYLKRTVIPVVILLGNFWPKFLFILCKVHQEKKWRLNSMLKDFDYHSWKLFHENINHDMIIIKHAYTWDIWWSQDW